MSVKAILGGYGLLKKDQLTNGISSAADFVKKPFRDINETIEKAQSRYEEEEIKKRAKDYSYKTAKVGDSAEEISEKINATVGTSKKTFAFETKDGDKVSVRAGETGIDEQKKKAEKKEKSAHGALKNVKNVYRFSKGAIRNFFTVYHVVEKANPYLGLQGR